MFWKPATAPAAVGFLAPVPDGGTDTPHINPENLTVIGMHNGLMYVRMTTGALLVLDSESLKRPVGILVPLDQHWATRVDALQAFRAQLLHKKRTASTLTPQQRRRIQLALRTLDARRHSASYQTIARHLFGAEAVSREHWKTSSLKAQITRLASHGTHLTTKGYRFLLLGRGPMGRSKRRK